MRDGEAVAICKNGRVAQAHYAKGNNLEGCNEDSETLCWGREVLEEVARLGSHVG